MRSLVDRLSYANVIATLALFIALGGGAYAVKKNSVGTKQLKNNAVTSKKIGNEQIKSKDVKGGGLKGKDLKDGTLGFDKLAGLETVYERGTVSASATDPDVARANATEVPLFSSGPFDVYGKCYADTDGDEVYAGAFIRTSKNRSILENILESGALGGGAPDAFFNTDTDEESRRIGIPFSVAAGEGKYLAEVVVWFPDAHAISPDGESLFAWVNTAAKNGTLAGGNGPYLGGDSCIWQGFYMQTS
jgi:hypothetical protein